MSEWDKLWDEILYGTDWLVRVKAIGDELQEELEIQKKVNEFNASFNEQLYQKLEEIKKTYETYDVFSYGEHLDKMWKIIVDGKE